MSVLILPLYGGSRETAMPARVRVRHARPHAPTPSRQSNDAMGYDKQGLV